MNQTLGECEDQFDGGSYDEFSSVAAKGNQVFVTGSSGLACDNSLTTNCDFIARAYKAQNGHLVWSDVVDKAGTEEWGQGIAVQGHRVFAAGIVFDANWASDLLVRAYAAGDDDEANTTD